LKEKLFKEDMWGLSQMTLDEVWKFAAELEEELGKKIPSNDAILDQIRQLEDRIVYKDLTLKDVKKIDAALKEEGIRLTDIDTLKSQYDALVNEYEGTRNALYMKQEEVEALNMKHFTVTEVVIACVGCVLITAVVFLLIFLVCILLWLSGHQQNIYEDDQDEEEDREESDVLSCDSADMIDEETRSD